MDKYYEGKQAASITHNGLANHGGAMPCDPVDHSASVIRDAVSGNEQILSELHETISRLEGRLDPALTPVPPQTSGTNSQVPNGPPCSHVTVRLGALNDGYRHAVQRLRELIQRVEV